MPSMLNALPYPRSGSLRMRRCVAIRPPSRLRTASALIMAASPPGVPPGKRVAVGRCTSRYTVRCKADIHDASMDHCCQQRAKAVAYRCHGLGRHSGLDHLLTPLSCGRMWPIGCHGCDDRVHSPRDNDQLAAYTRVTVRIRVPVDVLPLLADADAGSAR
jgi:hypothetical protein